LVVLRVPGLKLVARGFDFLVSDPLHHYMEWGMLQGIKRRAEQPLAGGDGVLGDGAAG
jgi:hypothetical protein